MLRRLKLLFRIAYGSAYAVLLAMHGNRYAQTEREAVRDAVLHDLSKSQLN